ncbi:MAG TPA: hypothetical protein VH592_25060 [Gemmataceae bacterium]|jgi:hypothetical protein
MTVQPNILDQPKIVPLPHEKQAGSSSLSISIVEGPTINLWSIETPREGKTEDELTLQLQPDQSVVIGRKEGGQIDYLDPRYHPTQVLPNSTRRVVTSFSRGSDLFVSRGHFMLRGSAQGILFVNGVPRRGGGIRPPMNGTKMLAPANRPMGRGEEYMIEKGTAIKIRLPNGTVILLGAA